MSKIICLMNARAGVGAKKLDAAGLKQLFAAQGLDVEVWQASAGADLPDLARKAVQAKPDILVACGGDGTINCAAAALLGSKTVLAVVPMGTLNHFARDLGISFVPEEAIGVIKAGWRKQVDVGTVNGRIFLNNSSLGLYPRLVRERENLQKAGHGKWPAFARAMMFLAFRYKQLHVRLKMQGNGAGHYRTPFIFIGNNAYQISGWNIGKRDRLDGGLLNLYLARFEGTAQMARGALRALAGSENSDAIDSYEATEFQITARKSALQVATDGEVNLMQTPLNYKIEKLALSVLAPEPDKPA